MSVQALSAAFAARGYTPSEKLVLLALANYADAAQRCFPSHATLADDTGLSERTILSTLKTLEEKGAIERQQRRRPDGSRASDLITLRLDQPATISPRGENERETKPQLTVVGGEMVSPHEPRTNHQIEEPKSEAIASARNGPDDEAWREGVVVLVSQGGMTVPAAKAFIGGLLKQNRIEARSLLGAIGECKANSTHDPKSYLAAAARARGRGRDTGPAKRVSFV